MNFDDLKDRLKGDLLKTKERLEENSTYNALRDRFQSQTPIVQRMIVIGVSGVLALIILSLPYGHLDTSHENVSEFESKRSLIRDLLHVQKEINETPEIPQPPPIDSIKTRIEADLQAAQLLPPQMKGVNVLPAVNTKTIKAVQNEGIVEVTLGQLNLRQVKDLGYDFQAISPSVKLKDLVVTASAGPAGYFDVIYRLLVLKVTPEELPPAEEPPPTKKKKGGK